MTRRLKPLSRALARVATALATMLTATHATAQTPLQLIVQQPPGSGSDTMARAWAECAARQLNQPVVVQNKAGANGILAINALKTQPADGNTMMTIGMSQMTITPYVHRQMPYDPLKDFDGVAMLGTSPLVLVVPADAGIQKLADLEKTARSRPGGLNFGSPGKGSPAHLLTTALAESFHWPATHVPFTGEVAGLTALIGHQIDAMTLILGTALPQLKAGKLVPLALFAGERSPLLPEVPTVTEAGGPKVLARPSWIAVVARRGSPPEALARVNEASNKCRADAAYAARMTAMNVATMAGRPGDVLSFAERDVAVWKPLIERLGLATE